MYTRSPRFTAFRLTATRRYERAPINPINSCSGLRRSVRSVRTARSTSFLPRAAEYMVTRRINEEDAEKMITQYAILDCSFRCHLRAP